MSEPTNEYTRANYAHWDESSGSTRRPSSTTSTRSSKFHGGRYLDRGELSRRHVVAAGIVRMGKEANRWEEQFYVGEDPDAQIEYGAAPEDLERLRGSVLRACKGLKVRELSRSSGVSLGEVSNVLRGRRHPTRETLVKLLSGAGELSRTTYTAAVGISFHRASRERSLRLNTRAQPCCTAMPSRRGRGC